MENNEIVATTFLKSSKNHSLLMQGSASLRISLRREFCCLRTGHIHPQLAREMAKVDGARGGKELNSQEVPCRELEGRF